MASQWPALADLLPYLIQPCPVTALSSCSTRDFRINQSRQALGKPSQNWATLRRARTFTGCATGHHFPRKLFFKRSLLNKSLPNRHQLMVWPGKGMLVKIKFCLYYAKMQHPVASCQCLCINACRAFLITHTLTHLQANTLITTTFLLFFLSYEAGRPAPGWPSTELSSQLSQFEKSNCTTLQVLT